MDSHAFWRSTELGQPSVSHQPEYRQALTQLNLVTLTPVALATINEGIWCDPVANVQPAHLTSHCHNLTTELMS
jgi:hypothetical protein